MNSQDQPTWTDSLCIGFSFCTAQVEYLGQRMCTEFLDCKNLINRCYWIRHRLALKYFHFTHVFFWCSLNNNSNIVESKWMMIFNFLFSVVYCSKIFKLKIEACPANAGLYKLVQSNVSILTFLLISTYLAANFEWIVFQFIPAIFYKFLLTTLMSLI